MTRLLGLSGRRGAGKDTAFGMVRDWASRRGVVATRRGFADALKLSFARIFIPTISLEEAVIWCDELKVGDGMLGGDNSQLSIVWQRRDEQGTTTGIQHTITGRQALQRYGTEGHRDVFGPNFWVDTLLPIDFLNEDEPETGVRAQPYWPLNFRGPLSADPPGIAAVTDVRFPNEVERIHELGGKIWEVCRPSVEDGDTHSSETPLPDDMIDRRIYNSIEGDLGKLRFRVEQAAISDLT